MGYVSFREGISASFLHCNRFFFVLFLAGGRANERFARTFASPRTACPLG